MSVRRLAPKELQPANFAFTDENLAWAKEQMAIQFDACTALLQIAGEA